jgi:hypothetical protein
MSNLPSNSAEFYKGVLSAFQDEQFPFLVGGTHAFSQYTGIMRPTKDCDLFLCREDYDLAAQLLTKRGYAVHIKFPHWLGKVTKDEHFIDLIYSSGNGVGKVDADWFRNARRGTILGKDVLMVPAEEMIWHKAFIMEKERYDGGDVAHLIHAQAEQLDWDRLMQRFGPHLPVLGTHLALFSFIYPGAVCRVPSGVRETIIDALSRSLREPASSTMCNGTLVSRQQYLTDIDRGLQDARLLPHGNMSLEDITLWTAGIAEDGTK